VQHALAPWPLRNPEVVYDALFRTAADVLAESRWRARPGWVVHVEAPEGRGVSQATKYLARTVRGVAISDARMVSMTSTHVTYRTRRGLVTLEGPEFVRRFA